MDQQYLSFLQIPQNSDFTIYNIPFGVCSVSLEQFPATIIGNNVVRLDNFERLGLFDGPLFTNLRNQGNRIFENNLDKFISLNKPYWQEARQSIQRQFSCGSQLEQFQEKLNQLIVDVNLVKYHLPMTIGEYTDFYSSKNHAFNIGSILRGPGNELQPNWVYLPVGYHGRRSSLVPTGTDLIRPWGQTKAPTQENPSFSVCKRLDFELEIGAILGGESNKLGVPVKIDQTEDRVFGLVLLNDWSARDIQGWEYVPLGPFTAKNLMTSISPWIVTIEALKPYTIELEKQIPEPFPYLREKNHTSFDINLQVRLQTQKNEEKNLFIETNFKYLYWSIAQQITHHSITGCSLVAGDIFGSGTISGTTRESRGCLMEYTWNGKEPLKLKNGEIRTYLEDGDVVEMTGYAGDGDKRVGFGSCEGKILPALAKEFFEN